MANGFERYQVKVPHLFQVQRLASFSGHTAEQQNCLNLGVQKGAKETYLPFFPLHSFHNFRVGEGHGLVLPVQFLNIQGILKQVAR